MKTLLPAAAAAFALALAMPALADPPDHGQTHQQHGQQHGQPQHGPMPGLMPGLHAYPHARMGNPHWSRGDRLDNDYRGQGYYVSDWHARHLRRPPRGYRWVHVNNQYLLVAITTGIILDAILSAQDN